MIGGKMKSKEFKEIFEEWNLFLKEEKNKKYYHSLKHDGKKIETIGQLKKILKKIEKKEITKIEPGVLKDLADIGINLLELGSGASNFKAFASLAHSLYKLKDSDSKKLGNLKGFDYNDKFQKVIKDEVLIKLLKGFVSNVYNDMSDDTLLSKIDINYLVANRVYDVIKNDLKRKDKERNK